MRLTDIKIKSLKPAKNRKIVWEDGGTGLGVRVFPSGIKSFIGLYRFGGKSRMLTIGKYPQIGLATAHIRWAEAKSKIFDGIDPGSLQAEEKAKHRDAHTVAHLVDEYIEKWAKPRKTTWYEDERCLNKEVIPKIGKRKAKDIRRRDIILILDSIVERGCPAMANRTMNVITKLFNFAVTRDILDASPCAALSLPAKKGKRDRALNNDEIEVFWKGLDESDMPIRNRIALKLILCTAQRRGEIVGAEWSEFNLDDKVWEIPSSKTKSERPNRVPINKLALSLLVELKQLSDDSKFLFPSDRTGGHIDPRAITRALRNIQTDFGIEQFKPHDLRRTAATGMAALGVQRLTISKILNHAEGGVTHIYDRHEYDQEKKHALETWEGKLESILTGKKAKVVSIRGKHGQ